MKRLAMSTLLMAGILTGCQTDKATVPAESLPWQVDRFADIEVLRYEVPCFESLPLSQKQLIYHLVEAAQWGRDIYWDQNCALNLPIRTLCEAIYQNYDGDRQDAQWCAFEQYMKQIWFANGIHHHYSSAKFNPGFSKEWFAALNKEYRERKDLVWKLFDLLGAKYDKDTAGLFVWGKVEPDNRFLEGTDPSKTLGERLSDKFLYDAGVFITPGFIFGRNGENYIRASVCATQPVIEDATKKIKELIK